MDGPTQLVLRCMQCNKPFDKESTLKRHGYYCRSKKTGLALRVRSCVACAKAKAKCDTKPAGCGRCLARSIACRYPAPAAKRGAGSSGESDGTTPTSTSSVASSNDASGDSLLEKQTTRAQDGMTSPDSIETSLVDMDIDWSHADLNFDDLLMPAETDKSNNLFPSMDLSTFTSDGLTSPSFSQTLTTQEQNSFPDLTFLIEPTQNPRSLIKRIKMNLGAQRSAHLLFQYLKSYTREMRGNTLPPFVHPHVFEFLPDGEMENWYNCMNLVQMRGGGGRGASKLFWRTVRMECERWRQEINEMSSWQLLAGLQALLVYIIIRLEEGETDENNLDALIIRTVAMISRRLNSIDAEMGTLRAPASYVIDQSWKDWIMEECGRRLCTVYQIINLLVYFEPAALCDLHGTGLILAPLPAKRQLWEADSQLSWEISMQQDPELQAPHGLTIDGELVRLDEGPRSCRDAVLMSELSRSVSFGELKKSRVDWEGWCEGMDGIRGFVMLGASLVG